ncbi:hypothetical protein BOTCAL_0341g00100 [Botryotinia calthae]|uniref:Uncharacterized protein n=1 Tax=Botryotinia calthae TaxID=38488 RepID=A0A4Y8CTQ4_9HELO|nr:hypothetical protein BOTCAL_0341g00100 [Botryotinia calthae]
MEQCSSSSQREPSSRFTNTNDRCSSKAGPSRSDTTTTKTENSTGLGCPHPWEHYSDFDNDDYGDDYDDDHSNFGSKNTILVSSLRTLTSQQSTTKKRKASRGNESPSNVVIHESCIEAVVSSPKFRAVKAKVELLEKQYPDDLPYTITFEHSTQTLYLKCQECNKSLSLLKGGGNIGSHASGVLHSMCVDKRLRKLEMKGFRRQLTKEVRARESALNSSPALIATTRPQRLRRQTQTSNQKYSALTPSENSESIPSSEDEQLRSKKRLLVAPPPTQSSADIPHPNLDRPNEMLTQHQEFEKRLEDAIIGINVRQSTQHRLLIDEVQKKISYGLIPLGNRVTTLEKYVQESYQSAQHKKLTEQRISKAWHSSESALRVIKKLKENVKASEQKSTACLNLVRELAEVVGQIEKGIPTSTETDRVGRLGDEIKGVKEVVTGIRQQNILDRVDYSDKGPQTVKAFQSQPDTDRVVALQERVNTLTAELSNLAGLVEKYELPTSHSSTFNDAAFIEDLKKSKGTMMKRLATSEERLAALEEQNDKLIFKIKDLEKGEETA